MLTTEYFRRLEDTVSSFPAITSTEITLDQRTRHIGFVKGTLTFHDGSELHFKEFIDVTDEVVKYKYAYHYQKDDKHIFRYDNHPIPLREIPEHHKHDQSEEHILKSNIPDLQAVLNEVLKSLPE